MNHNESAVLASDTSAAPGGIRSLASPPLTERVRAEIEQSILSGAFTDEWLPSEPDLAVRLSVSRTTVRSALRALEEEGLVTRQRGLGTRINTHVERGLSLTRVVGFYDLIAQAGFSPSIAQTTISYGPADPKISQALNIAEGSELMIIDRLFLADGHAAISVKEMLPTDRVLAEVSPADVPNTIFEFADSLCDWRVDHTVVKIKPALVDAQLAPVLGLEVGAPYLHLFESHYSPDGHPFIASDIAVVDEYVSFTVVRRRY